MMVCREASRPARTVRTEAVLPAPTSPVTTPMARSAMHQVIRAQASLWAAWRGGQGADDVVGRRRLAQPGFAAGEPVQAADRLRGDAGQAHRVVASDLLQADDLPEVIHGRPPRLLPARPAPGRPARRRAGWREA